MTTVTERPSVIRIGNVNVDVGPRITLNPAYPPVALELLLDIVAWAEQDARQEADPKYREWGTWEQGSWASVDLSPSAVAVPLKEIAEAYDDDEDQNGDPAVYETNATVLVQSAARANLCGSAFCMAGQTVYQAGFRMILDESPLNAVGQETYADECIAEYDTGNQNEKGMPIWKDVPDAEPVSIDSAALRILGLVGEEGALFEGDNGIPKIKRIVNMICEHRSLPLPYPDHPIYPDGDDGYDADDD